MSSNGNGKGNKAVGTVPVELDKPRNLKWTHRCIFALEEHAGINAAIEHPLVPPTMRKIVTATWAALQHEDRALTLEEAYRLVLESDNEALLEALFHAYNLAMPEKKRVPQDGIDLLLGRKKPEMSPPESIGSDDGASEPVLSGSPTSSSGA